MPSISFKRRLLLIVIGMYFLYGIIVAIGLRLDIQMPDLSFPVQVVGDTPYWVLNQGWFMFTKPPMQRVELKYSAITGTGWTPVEQPLPNLIKEMDNAFIMIPRGAIRPVSLLVDKVVVAPSTYRKFAEFAYYQLSNYYCFGAGRIPGIIRINLYLEKKAIPPFHATHRASSEDGLSLVYFRNCLGG